MSLPAPYPALKLRAEPVAELSGFVASSIRATAAGASSLGVPGKPSSRLTKPPAGASTALQPKQGGRFSAHRSAPLHSCARSSSNVRGKGCKPDQHERVLELLRTALATAKISTANANTGTDSSAVCGEPAARLYQGLNLEEHRAALIAQLREMQHPQAESITTINSLLNNRAKLGLLDPASVSEYCCAAQNSDNADEEGTAACPIGAPNLLQPTESNLSSSFNSDDTATTLASADDEAAEASGPLASAEAEDLGQQPSQSLKSSFIESWATNGFWRGVSTRSWSSQHSRRRRRTSVSSEHTLVAHGDALFSPGAAADAPAAMSDVLGICWPMDDAAREAAHNWGRFYADLGDVRVPTRFRVPQHSLTMLATEQLMMRNDKIICPLKNRLQEVNPRRQRFEDYIRSTGCIPPPAFAGDLPPSPLRHEITAQARSGGIRAPSPKALFLSPPIDNHNHNTTRSRHCTNTSTPPHSSAL
ncbi:hypothetical protein GQ54DRAFT_320176 [Martensiomyces pterosporus]|nr:hypothetical protein GQ54DRAFT_320176 [Martensiomyces pterosporus]